MTQQDWRNSREYNDLYDAMETAMAAADAAKQARDAAHAAWRASRQWETTPDDGGVLNAGDATLYAAYSEAETRYQALYEAHGSALRAVEAYEDGHA